MSQTNKIALVTGSNRGIGFAVAQGLLKKGIEVIATSRNEKDSATMIEKLSKLGTVYYHPLDVTSQESVDSIRQFIEEKFGRLDILINNAGINYDTWHTIENADLNNVQETLDTNLIGPWRMAQAFIPLMKKNRYGRIVNVSSGAGSFADQNGGTPGYSISKLASNGLTLALGRQLSNHNILVNSVCPGWVRTDMGGGAAPRSVEQGAETIIWSALLPDDGPTAKFFRDQKEIPW